MLQLFVQFSKESVAICICRVLSVVHVCIDLNSAEVLFILLLFSDNKDTWTCVIANIKDTRTDFKRNSYFADDEILPPIRFFPFILNPCHKNFNYD